MNIDVGYSFVLKFYVNLVMYKNLVLCDVLSINVVCVIDMCFKKICVFVDDIFIEVCDVFFFDVLVVDIIKLGIDK